MSWLVFTICPDGVDYMADGFYAPDLERALTMARRRWPWAKFLLYTSSRPA